MSEKLDKEPKLIEPIPTTMEQVVRSFFAKDTKPKKPSKKDKKNQSSPTKLG